MPGEAVRASGTWLVIGMVAVAAVFAALTWRRYSADNPTSAKGVLRREAGAWVAEVAFEPAVAKRIQPGALAVLTMPDHPGEPMRGAVESVDAGGVARVRITQTAPSVREGPLHATIEIAPGSP